MSIRRLVFLPLLVLALVSACATPPGRRSVVSELDAGDRARAREAYDALLANERSGDARETYDAGLALLNNYPGADQESHALLITARAAHDLDDRRAEERLLDLLVRDHPDNEYAVEGWYDLALLHRTAAAGPPRRMRSSGSMGESRRAIRVAKRRGCASWSCCARSWRSRRSTRCSRNIRTRRCRARVPGSRPVAPTTRPTIRRRRRCASRTS